MHTEKTGKLGNKTISFRTVWTVRTTIISDINQWSDNVYMLLSLNKYIINNVPDKKNYMLHSLCFCLHDQCRQKQRLCSISFFFNRNVIYNSEYQTPFFRARNGTGMGAVLIFLWRNLISARDKITLTVTLSSGSTTKMRVKTSEANYDVWYYSA